MNSMVQSASKNILLDPQNQPFRTFQLKNLCFRSVSPHGEEMTGQTE